MNWSALLSISLFLLILVATFIIFRLRARKKTGTERIEKKNSRRNAIVDILGQLVNQRSTRKPIPAFANTCLKNGKWMRMRVVSANRRGLRLCNPKHPNGPSLFRRHGNYVPAA